MIPPRNCASVVDVDVEGRECQGVRRVVIHPGQRGRDGEAGEARKGRAAEVVSARVASTWLSSVALIPLRPSTFLPQHPTPLNILRIVRHPLE